MKRPNPSSLPRIIGLLLACLITPLAHAQAPAFAVATIRPSSGSVQFEHDGQTETSPGSLRMHDVTVHTCIKWAYSVQDNQIAGPAWLDSERYDIVAKADAPATEAQMKIMLQTLLADRFALAFHREQKEMKAIIFTVVPGGSKLTPAANPDAKPFRQNSANGTIAKAMPIADFIDFLSGPLQMPAVDHTGLTGKYDFTLDFTPYLPDAKNMGPDRPDAVAILKAALHDELGLNMEGGKSQVDVLVIDHVEKPSAN
jgi:uncharacterized protein (TIGR03435 family)